MEGNDMQLKILISTSTIVETWEAYTSIARRLLDEGQVVGILGKTELQLPEHPNLHIFHTLTEAKEFEPNIVLPLDHGAGTALQNYWESCRAHTLYKDALGLYLQKLRSFGLSILASAGLPTVPHMVLSNSNDLLRFEARKQEDAEAVWDLYPDHPLFLSPTEHGSLAIQTVVGQALSFCCFVSDSKPGKEDEEIPAVLPPLAFMPLTGLLRRGGVQDYRGVVAQFVHSPAAMMLSRRVKAACQTIGLKGLVFLDMVYPEKGDGMAVRLYTAAPAGFMTLLMQSGILTGKFHETMNSLLKDRRFALRHNREIFWSLLVGNPAYATNVPEVAWNSVPGLVSSPRLPIPSYEFGYLALDNQKNIPESVWEQCPTAEVKLDLTDSEEKFSKLLDTLGLCEKEEVK